MDGRRYQHLTRPMYPFDADFDWSPPADGE
jgi:hypothetical protein